METLSTLGPPCPRCGGSAFAWTPTDNLLVEIGDSRFQPRVCAECGTIQLLLTRADEWQSGPDADAVLRSV